MRESQQVASGDDAATKVVTLGVAVSKAGREISAEHAEVLDVVRRVGAQAAARAEEIDESRKFPKELYDELHGAGVIYALAPKKYGGHEMPLELVNEIIFIGSRANGSLGWLLMVGTAQGVGHGFYPPEFYEKMRRETPRPKSRGAIAPKPKAVPTEGGYLVSGQWPFASGGANPDWVSVNCIVFRDGKPSVGPDGRPEALTCVAPARDAKFLDTWHVLGMKGTDSCDMAFDNYFVPAERAYNVFTTKNSWETPLARAPLRVVLAMGHVAVALGIAQGALDDITELAQTKRASMNPGQRLYDNEVFRYELGEHALRLTAMKAMLEQVSANAVQAGLEGRDFTQEETLVGRTSSAFITAECVKIVDWAYTAAGSSSVYNNSSLQRRFRDIHVATQHASCHTDPYRQLGRILLGEQLTPAELF